MGGGGGGSGEGERGGGRGERGGGSRKLPYVGYIGMCNPKGYVL